MVRGRHFWARGYCVSTVGLDEKTVRDYIRNQEETDRLQEELDYNYLPFSTDICIRLPPEKQHSVVFGGA